MCFFMLSLKLAIYIPGVMNSEVVAAVVKVSILVVVEDVEISNSSEGSIVEWALEGDFPFWLVLNSKFVPCCRIYLVSPYVFKWGVLIIKE